MTKPIYVARPSLPPLQELLPYLEQIWDSRILTNNGPFHQQLEDALCKYLDVPYISLVANGTMALCLALKALDVQGQVITTPYTFAATSNAINWSGLTPVFVDIDPVTLNLDPEKVEGAITDHTAVILPVHVYGTPSDVDAIESIATKYNLRTIYDAAHAFGVRCHCGSVLNHGDLSVLSFHATKVFNTCEGGAIISHDLKTKTRIDRLKNFGFADEASVVQIGINGKLQEFNAALGLVQLDHIDEQIEKRGAVDRAYREGLKDIEGIRCQNISNIRQKNYSYFPVFVDDEYPLSRDRLYDNLKLCSINARRYFYPLVTDFDVYQKNRPKAQDGYAVAKNVAERVICLPIYADLTTEEIDKTLTVIRQGAISTHR